MNNDYPDHIRKLQHAAIHGGPVSDILANMPPTLPRLSLTEAVERLERAYNKPDAFKEPPRRDYLL